MRRLTAKADCICGAECEVEYQKNSPNARQEAFHVVREFNVLHAKSCAERLKRVRWP